MEIPLNWCVLITEYNKSDIDQYLKYNKDKYEGKYRDSWFVSVGRYFHRPSGKDYHSSEDSYDSIEISSELFYQEILNKTLVYEIY